MRPGHVLATLASVLIIAASSRLSAANVEEIVLDGQTYTLVRLSEDEIKQLIPEFEAEMKERKLPGRIVQCISGIDLPVGTAYCVLRNEDVLTTVQICKDYMVGHFSVSPVDVTAASIWSLANFVRKNCYGG
ncbi:hypothetical protein [Microvirga splendida]|uniref:Rap1a immunity protein domain-containing protein n=1 Tax=Microvirga splendida TaxID=2795727 RepID=A0ABS0Y484_9HYPH|nr:hypothetical protein [Microvirga splendida]MBJ6127116.1 hypothetical protein [Microvirga splendida]